MICFLRLHKRHDEKGEDNNNLRQMPIATNQVPQSEAKQSMDIVLWNGTITWYDFQIAANEFVERWKRLNHAFPPWTWVPSPKRHLGLTSNKSDGYLTLERLCLAKSTKNDMISQEDSRVVTQIVKKDMTSFEEEELVDSATLVESNGVGVHYYDFHIVYSASYRVPVFFFRAYRIDGQPLTLEEIEKDLPASSAKGLLESKWTFITQEDHPHLNRLWYKLHPCGTSEWMKLLFQSDTSVANNGVAIELYIVSWLSVVGQVFGLRIPFELLNYNG